MAWPLLARCRYPPGSPLRSQVCLAAHPQLSRSTNDEPEIEAVMLSVIATKSVLWLPFTVGIYWISSQLYWRVGRLPLLNPTLMTIAAVCCALLTLGVPYAAYFESVSILHYLLGTAVVALSVPLYRNLHKLARELRSISIAVAAGSFTSIIGGLVIAKALGASPAIVLSIAPKS